jgi:MFS family permease
LSTGADTLSQLVTGIVSYGIGRTNTALAPWRLLFLVIGAFTLVWGVLLLWRLPDSPTKDNFLSGKDRYIALDRVKDNMTGIENKVRLTPLVLIQISMYGSNIETETKMVPSP